MSEVRNPTNSDPATTAEQAEECTYVPTAVKADDGCNRTAPGRRGLSHHWGTDVLLSSLCGRRWRPDFLTLNDTARRLLPRAHHRRWTRVITVPTEDKLILLGDFYARVDRDCRLWNNIIDKEGLERLTQMAPSCYARAQNTTL